MQLKDIVLEGAFVVKNKDGVEKRFKNADSAAAKAWKETSKPKKEKLEKYSAEWWMDKHFDGELTPGTPIKLDSGDESFTSDKFDAMAKDMGFGEIEDYTAQGGGLISVHGVPTATLKIRLLISYSPEDDLGLDEPTTDSQNILIRRDTKNPKKFVFVKYL